MTTAKLWAVLSDIQIPFHDAKVLDLVIRFIESIKPHGVVLNGDVCDMYCVDPNIRILTYDLKWVRARDLQVGDRLITFDEESPGMGRGSKRLERKLRSGSVTQTGLRTLPGAELTLDNGDILRCSAEHKWLGWYSTKNATVVQWMSVSEIIERVKHGRAVLLQRCTKPWESEETYRSGFLRAAFDGEGSITFHKRANNFGHLSFAQKPGVLFQEVIAALESDGFKVSLQWNKASHAYVAVICGGLWEFARFIGKYRPYRFVAKWIEKAPIDGHPARGNERSRVVSARHLDSLEVVTLSTNTKTYLAEGYAAHNSISRFSKNPLGPKSLDLEIKVAAVLMKRLAECTQERWWLGGNHEDRLRKYVWNNPEQFQIASNVRATYAFSALFNLQHYGFQWREYGQGVWLGKLFVTHGSIVRKHSGETARAHYQKYGVPVLVGHSHRLGAYYHTDLSGPAVAFENGCLCRLDPEYEQHPNWQQGFSLVHVDTASKLFHVDQLPILKRSMLFYGGKRFE